MTKKEWIEREQVGLKWLDMEISGNTLTALWKDGFGSNHYYVPQGLTRTVLLTAFQKLGLKLPGEVSAADYKDGEQLPTEAGGLEQNFEKIMTPTDERHRPFMCNEDEQNAWAKELGGEGLCSAEEVLYLLLRAFLTFGRIPFMGGWIRARNAAPVQDSSVGVRWGAGGGLEVFYGSRSEQDWDYGAVARKFRKSLVPQNLEPFESLDLITVNNVKYRRVE